MGESVMPPEYEEKTKNTLLNSGEFAMAVDPRWVQFQSPCLCRVLHKQSAEVALAVACPQAVRAIARVAPSFRLPVVSIQGDKMTMGQDAGSLDLQITPVSVGTQRFPGKTAISDG